MAEKESHPLVELPSSGSMHDPRGWIDAVTFFGSLADALDNPENDGTGSNCLAEQLAEENLPRLVPGSDLFCQPPFESVISDALVDFQAEPAIFKISNTLRSSMGLRKDQNATLEDYAGLILVESAKAYLAKLTEQEEAELPLGMEGASKYVNDSILGLPDGKIISPDQIFEHFFTQVNGLTKFVIPYSKTDIKSFNELPKGVRRDLFVPLSRRLFGLLAEADAVFWPFYVIEARNLRIPAGRSGRAFLYTPTGQCKTTDATQEMPLFYNVWLALVLKKVARDFANRFTVPEEMLPGLATSRGPSPVQGRSAVRRFFYELIRANYRTSMGSRQR